MASAKKRRQKGQPQTEDERSRPTWPQRRRLDAIDELDAVQRSLTAALQTYQPDGGQLDVDLNDSASESSHGRHDRRSLALHLEAVRMLQEQPALAQRVLDVLDRWETVADLQSKMLRDEWRRIVLGRLWDLAIEDSERGRQLRQASPLGFVLVTSVRDAIFRTYRTRRK